MYDYICSLSPAEVREAGSTPEAAADALIAWERRHGSQFAEPGDDERKALIRQVRSYAWPESLPPGRTAESAFYANDGPAEQVIADLQAIIRDCREWDTEAARALRLEAEAFLAAREA